jgi:hypothetical protein
MKQRTLIAGSPEMGTTPEFSPEDLLLQQAMEIDPENTAPEVAVPVIEAAIFACNQLIFVYTTWYMSGINRDQSAINRGAAAFIRFYDTYASDEEKNRNKPLISSGGGWAPGHVAALSIHSQLVDKWAQSTAQANGKFGEMNWEDRFIHTGAVNTGYLQPVIESMYVSEDIYD